MEDVVLNEFVPDFKGTSDLNNVNGITLPRWCLHLNVVGEFASFWDPESYAGGSVATGRATQAGQVKG